MAIYVPSVQDRMTESLMSVIGQVNQIKAQKDAMEQQVGLEREKIQAQKEIAGAEIEAKREGGYLSLMTNLAMDQGQTERVKLSLKSDENKTKMQAGLTAWATVQNLKSEKYKADLNAETSKELANIQGTWAEKLQVLQNAGALATQEAANAGAIGAVEAQGTQQRLGIAFQNGLLSQANTVLSKTHKGIVDRLVSQDPEYNTIMAMPDTDDKITRISGLRARYEDRATKILNGANNVFMRGQWNNDTGMTMGEEAIARNADWIKGSNDYRMNDKGNIEQAGLDVKLYNGTYIKVKDIKDKEALKQNIENGFTIKLDPEDVGSAYILEFDTVEDRKAFEADRRMIQETIDPLASEFTNLARLRDMAKSGLTPAAPAE